MPIHTEHLSREQLSDLLEAAVSFLPASKRRLLLGMVPAPPVPPPSSATALATVVDVAEGLQAFLDDHSEDAATWIQGDDWSHNEEFDGELAAWQAELNGALKEAVAWLASQKATPGLTQQLGEVMAAIDELNDWECEYATGVTYGELAPRLEHLEPFSVWAYLLENTKAAPAEIAAGMVAEWHCPVGASLLLAALGNKKAGLVGAALVVLADEGNAAAARWLLLAAPDDVGQLTRYAPLAPDLGQRWSMKMSEGGHWEEIVKGRERNVAVRHDIMYRAALELKRYDILFRDVFTTDARVPISQVWDDAVGAGELDLLRQVARTHSRGAAKWIALDEPDLLHLPPKYDHEAVKAAVSYAIARASKGRLKSEARAYALDEALLARLATAPGPHDEARCVDTALSGLEQMVAFHIAGRSRHRYARAAAYWAQHGALCQAFELPLRHLGLRATFFEELRRLPALRDELGRAGASWR